MRYLSWILPGKLVTRPGPRGVAWDLEQIRDAAGIEVVVSLSDEAEAADVARAGLLHVQNYLPDAPLYTEAECRAFIAQALPAVEAIERELALGKKVLVHCHAGRDRTGFVVAAVLTRTDGRSAKEALAEIRRIKSYCEYPGFDRALELLTGF